MKSRERVLLALGRKKVDKIPWVEIYFDNKIASKILNKEIFLPYGYNGAEKDEHNLTIPEHSRFNNLKDYQKGLKDWIELAKKINLDVLGMHFWAPVFVEMITSSSGEKREGQGLISSQEEFKRLIEKVKRPSKINYEFAHFFVQQLRKENLASFFAISFCMDIPMRAIGFEKFCLSLYDDYDFIDTVLDWYTDYTIELLPFLEELNPDFIWVAEDIAYQGGSFISPDSFRKIVLPKYKRIASRIKSPWIYHSDGNLMPIMDDLISLGMSALHPIQPEAMDIFEVREKYGNRISLVGNVSIDTLARGKKEDVRGEVNKLLSSLNGRGGGYLLSSSNAIVHYLNPENVVILGKRRNNR